MIESLMVIWIIFFIIFFLAGIVEKSYTLGVISGVILLLFGLAIIITGVQIQSGETLTSDGDTFTIEYNYEDATLPFSTYSYVFGMIFILTSIFIIYANAENL